MKLLVTGGSGFIGSAFCRLVHAQTDHKIANLDALTYAAAPGSLAAVEGSQRYAFVHADVADAAAVTQAFAEHRPDAVVHLAAESHVDRSVDGAGPFVRTNVTGAYVMLQAALEHWRGLEGAARERFRFLHVSTDEVFGSLGPEGLFDEASPYDPRSPYSATKAAADHLARAWFHTYGLPVVLTNCSNNYGPFHFPEKLIPLTILNALEGRPIAVYGDGGQVRDWLHVEDHAAALLAAVERGVPGESYNIGARSERTNLQVVHAICDALDRLAPDPDGPRRRLITHVADRPGHDRRYAIDPAKAERELGWRPQHGFEAGLESTVRWYLDNRPWWEPLRARYAGDRIGLTPGAPQRAFA